MLLPPPQAASPRASAMMATSTASAASGFCRSFSLFTICASTSLARFQFLRLVGGDGVAVARRGRPAGRLADKVHMLGLPAQRDPGATAGQALALGLVGVGDEDGHPRPLAEVDLD